MSFNRLYALTERMFERDAQNTTRVNECAAGAFLWVCEVRSLEAFNLLRDDGGRVNGQPFWKWRRYHKKERFTRRPHSLRAICGARTRHGRACKARVCLRADGSAAKRCRLHGGLSSGPRSPRTKDTTDTRTRLFMALILGEGVVAACRAAGVSTTTVYRWISKDANFEAAVNMAYQQGTKKREERRTLRRDG